MNLLFKSLLILFFSITILSCFSDHVKINKNKEVIKNGNKKEDNQLNYLIGKPIECLDLIIGMDINSSSVVFLFGYHDCETCVDAGFYVTKKIDSLCKSQIVYAISNIGNPHTYQQRNKYYNYIFSDEKDLIRRELKYMPTPIMLYLDSNKTIQNIFSPKDTLSVNYSFFVNDILSKN